MGWTARSGYRKMGKVVSLRIIASVAPLIMQNQLGYFSNNP